MSVAAITELAAVSPAAWAACDATVGGLGSIALIPANALRSRLSVPVAVGKVPVEELVGSSPPSKRPASGSFVQGQEGRNVAASSIGCRTPCLWAPEQEGQVQHDWPGLRDGGQTIDNGAETLQECGPTPDQISALYDNVVALDEEPTADSLHAAGVCSR